MARGDKGLSLVLVGLTALFLYNFVVGVDWVIAGLVLLVLFGVVLMKGSVFNLLR